MENNNEKVKPLVIDEIERMDKYIKELVAESEAWAGVKPEEEIIISRVDEEYEKKPIWVVWKRWVDDKTDLAAYGDWYVDEDTYRALLDYPHRILKIDEARKLMKYGAEYCG
jgi:hypothetical protein